MKSRAVAAFTGWDVLILLTTAILVAAVLVPRLARARVHNCGVRCISNQKQVALAIRMWANDQDDVFPMAIQEARGGSKESAMEGNPIPTFVALSNELVKPIILYCPQDAKRGPRALTFEQLSSTNTSYSVAIDASETNAASILVADRNIILPHVFKPQGLLSITNWKHAVWSGDIHRFQGHIALADGSVSQVGQNGLQKALRDSGLATNRFAVP